MQCSNPLPLLQPGLTLFGAHLCFIPGLDCLPQLQAVLTVLLCCICITAAQVFDVCDEVKHGDVSLVTPDSGVLDNGHCHFQDDAKPAAAAAAAAALTALTGCATTANAPGRQGKAAAALVASYALFLGWVTHRSVHSFLARPAAEVVLHC
jgi:hypothetical protein